MEPLAFVSIVLVGSWVIAARARARGQSPSQCVCLLIGLSMFGGMIFGVLGVIVGCGLWGFDPAPPWERYFLFGAVLAGTLGGIAASFLIAWRTDPRRIAERRAVEADYDEPERPGPGAGPAPSA